MKTPDLTCFNGDEGRDEYDDVRAGDANIDDDGDGEDDDDDGDAAVEDCSNAASSSLRFFGKTHPKRSGIRLLLFFFFMFHYNVHGK